MKDKSCLLYLLLEQVLNLHTLSTPLIHKKKELYKISDHSEMCLKIKK